MLSKNVLIIDDTRATLLLNETKKYLRQRLGTEYQV